MLSKPLPRTVGQPPINQNQNQNQVQDPQGMSEKEAIQLEIDFNEYIERLTTRFVELGSLSALPSPAAASVRVHQNGSKYTSTHDNTTDRNRERDRERERVDGPNRGQGLGEGQGQGEALGLVAQSVHSFLRHRQQQIESHSHTQSNSLPGSAVGRPGARPGGGSGIGIGGFLSSSLLNGAPRPNEHRTGVGAGTGAEREDDLLSAFEKIESPLQAMKRAGLDLLTTGWGR